MFTNDKGLWTRAIKAKSLQNNMNFFTYKSKATDSPVWKSITKTKELMRTGIIWKVGNGDTISF